MASRYIKTFCGKPVVLPQSLDGLDGVPTDWASRANSYECPVGFEPGVGWVLMNEAHADALDMNSSGSLVWVDGTTETTFTGLIPRRVTKMTLGLSNRVCLVEFTDQRAAIRGSINDQYNVRMPAPKNLTGTNNYYAESLNSGSLWTWQTMLDDIWSNLNSYAGASPTLPYSPDGSPEMFRFVGVPAWDAVKLVLDKIGCTAAFDPTAGTFSIIRLGSTQSGLAAAKTAATFRLMYDYDPVEGNLHRAPATFRVFFHRKEEYYGIEKDTPQSDNWEMEPATAVDVASGITGGSGVWPIWDDLPAMFDSTETITNSSALSTRASEVAANMASRFITPTRQHYSGILTSMLPGSEISKVVWRDYGDETGTVTEIRYHPPAQTAVGRHGIAERHMLASGLPPGLGEVLEASGVGRSRQPTWPRLPQFVKVTGSEDSTNGIWPGTVERYVEGAWTSLDACWVAPIEGRTKQGLDTDRRYIARLAGLEQGTSGWRPVYVVDPHCRAVIVRFTLTSTLALGGTASATIQSCAADTFCMEDDLVGTSITVEDISASPGTWKSDIGKEGVAYWNGDAACNYTILWVEEQAVFISATLTSTFSGTPSQATATVDDSWQGYGPTGTQTIEDRCDAYGDFQVGDCIIACYDDENDVYVPIDPAAGGIYIWENCYSYGGSEITSAVRRSLLTFDKTAFAVEPTGTPTETHVFFRRGSLAGMFWNQVDPASAPDWKTCPEVRHSLIIGSQPEATNDKAGTLILKNANATGQHEFQSFAGNSETHWWELPPIPATTVYTDQWCGRHLIVDAGTTDGNANPCIRWKYSEVGWTGDSLVDKHDYTYEFSCGLLVYTTNPDFAACAAGTTPSCTRDTCVTDDPCA